TAVGGGGISSDGALIVAHTTFVDNAGGDLFIFTIPGLPAPQGVLTLASSVFEAGSGGSLPSNGGEVISLGGNLFSDAPGIPLAPTDRVGTDPGLGPLA